MCAQLVKEGTVDAVASEDMDTLPFGGNVLVRQLNAKRDRYVHQLHLLIKSIQLQQVTAFV